MTTPDTRLNDLKIDRTQSVTRSGWSRWRWPGLMLAAVAVGVLWYAVPQAESVQTVSVVSSTPSQQHVVLTASGYVVAQRRASVASKATGRLVALYVREGSRVKRGEVMARLDPSDVVAAMAAAESLGSGSSSTCASTPISSRIVSAFCSSNSRPSSETNS